MTEDKFPAFPKIPRLKRGCVISEKIDGTNALVSVAEDGTVRAGSRSRWITPTADNFGFARWVEDHADDLRALGPGLHYGEWYGAGIQRRYGLDHKRFALFNSGRWSNNEARPKCCTVVPVVYAGDFTTNAVENALAVLRDGGSIAVPGFAKPEGVVVYLPASGHLYKVLIENDAEPKTHPTQMRGQTTTPAD
jgi:hypothetical protein